MQETKVKMVKLSVIDPDEAQPRKNFDPQRLAELSSSIKKHGIMNPLIVEEKKGGRFILVDGERRYRASTELKLPEVPVIVRAPQSDTHRLIEQFHLQEQHQGWSPIEKAIAVVHLSEALKLGVPELANLLSIPKSTIGDYQAFAKLIERKEFEKNEVSIGYAGAIIALRTTAKNAYMKHDKELTEDMERALEMAVIARIKRGEIQRKADIGKIKHSILTDHTSLKKLLDTDITVDKLFISSNAKTSSAARNLIYSASYIQKHAKDLMVAGGLEMVGDARSQNILIGAKKVLEDVLRG